MEAETPNHSFDIMATLTAEVGIKRGSVEAVVNLLSGGATVPFIARYRKEATGGLDEVQIRAIRERHTYLRELEDRRRTVLKTIEEQGKLTDELRAKILACVTKRDLEDLYLPYKPKRRTKATIAREKGLEPLAIRILEQPPSGDPDQEALAFVDPEKGVNDATEALKGAFDIVVETVAETAEVRALVRKAFAEQGVLRARAVKDQTKERTKFEDYYDFSEPVGKIPSHRYLAICRGESEGVLKVGIEVEEEPLLSRIQVNVGAEPDSPFGPLLVRAIAEAYKRRLTPAAENDVRSDLKARSDGKAVEIFADNLEHLLLQAPLGGRPVLGVDPGLRTGSKCAAVDETGKFLENRTIYTTKGEEKLEQARKDLKTLITNSKPYAVAVGDGTGGRELDQFVRTTLTEANLADTVVVQVSEAGASVYSASDVARQEFPDLDVTVRGAISIARRLQDPLAELVKIEPKSIGVGQYQHDVNQTLLHRKLGEVVESCVNRVGVELNTASAPLLSYVAGVGPSLARKIVAHREANGPFSNRHGVLKVGGFGPKAFEQAAGFLRLRESDHPLDRSAVHPERYALVERVAADMEVSLGQLVGSAELADGIDISRYVGDGVGEPTLKDIVEELKKPGRDPRARFEAPKFRDDVHTLEDLNEGMVLEGVVTNVTAFGAFVNIGVHQDGLVHISQLADRYVRDPHKAVRVGERITVRVLAVDLERRRISLSARMEGERSTAGPARARKPDSKRTAHRKDKNGRRDHDRRDRDSNRKREKKKPANKFTHTPFADLLKNRQED